MFSDKKKKMTNVVFPSAMFLIYCRKYFFFVFLDMNLQYFEHLYDYAGKEFS